jgi:pseudouridine synthase
MRINKFIAAATGLSRRAADEAMASGRVRVNGLPPKTGQNINGTDSVLLDGQQLKLLAPQTILLHKPIGYVVSRDGQGSRTVYELLPSALHHLKPVGRLDKNSSGLLLLTSDGELAQRLTHPRYQKTKTYEIQLDKPLVTPDQQRIERGVQLEDGLSRLKLNNIGDDTHWRVQMHEGRNRQIRRTFAALGYEITTLHRTTFGDYHLPDHLNPGEFLTA